MPLDAISQINAIDLIVLILLIRICIIAVKTGLVTEGFKLLGTITSIYLSFHYFTTLGDFFRGGRAAKGVDLEFVDFLAFLLLVLLGYGFFIAVRMAFGRFIKAEAAPRLNKVGAFILSVFRGLLTGSLLVFMLIISSVGVFKERALSSYTGKNIYKMSYSLYSGMWNGFFSKFMPQEKFNNTLLEIQESLSQK